MKTKTQMSTPAERYKNIIKNLKMPTILDQNLGRNFPKTIQEYQSKINYKTQMITNLTHLKLINRHAISEILSNDGKNLFQGTNFFWFLKQFQKKNLSSKTLITSMPSSKIISESDIKIRLKFAKKKSKKNNK